MYFLARWQCALCLKAQCAALSLCVCLCEQTRCSAGCAALSPGRPSPLNKAACIGVMQHKVGKSSRCRWHTRTPRWLLPDLHSVTASVHLLLGYELCQHVTAMGATGSLAVQLQCMHACACTATH